MLGIRDFFPHAGSYGYLLEQCRLTAEQIAEDILKALN
jgi:transketolase